MHTCAWHLLQVILLLSPKTTLHPSAEQRFFFFFARFDSSQLDGKCRPHATSASSFPCMRMDSRQMGQTMTFVSLPAASGHLCLSYVRCSMQYTLWQQSHLNGRKSRCLHVEMLHTEPRWNSISEGVYRGTADSEQER
jgi:hypothetical protein